LIGSTYKMPTPLAQQNVALLTVGQSGTIDLTQAFGGQSIPDRPGYGTKAIYTVRMLNESSSGLQVAITPSNQAFQIPAGGWVDCHPIVGDTTITYTILYMLPGAQVALILSTLYVPGEIVPPMPILGNSSVGISGSVNTNAVGTTLINIGGVASATPIIEVASTTSAGDVTTLDNRGNFKNGNATVPGTVSLDNGLITTDGTGDLSVQGHVILNNNVTLQIKDASATPQDAVYGDAANELVLQSLKTNGPIFMKGKGGVSYCSFNNNGYNGPTGDPLCRVGSSGGTGTGTFNHDLGATPDFAAITTHVAGSTQNVGYDSETSTQFHVDTGAGLTWFALLTKRS
jgi:hypothetical protein